MCGQHWVLAEGGLGPGLPFLRSPKTVLTTRLTCTTCQLAPHCLLCGGALVSLGPFPSFYPSLPHPAPAGPPASGDDLNFIFTYKTAVCRELTSTSRPALATGLSVSPPILPASLPASEMSAPVAERGQPVHLGSEPITHPPRSRSILYSARHPTFSISVPHPVLALSPQSTNAIGS